MNQLRTNAQVMYIIGFLVTIEEAKPLRQTDVDDGGVDDAPRVIRHIDEKPNLSIAPVNRIKPMSIPMNWDKKSIASDWLIERMSKLQAAVVDLRKSYEKVMRDHAAWSCRWMQAHFPEYFACVTKNYVDLVVDDCKDYPNSLLMTIRFVKELYIRSKVRQIPINTLNSAVFDRTEYYINGLLPAIDDHREMLQDLLQDKLLTQTTSVRVICQLPMVDRYPFHNTTEPDPVYVFEEDYSPIAYNRL